MCSCLPSCPSLFRSLAPIAIFFGSCLGSPVIPKEAPLRCCALILPALHCVALRLNMHDDHDGRSFIWIGVEWSGVEWSGVSQFTSTTYIHTYTTIISSLLVPGLGPDYGWAWLVGWLDGWMDECMVGRVLYTQIHIHHISSLTCLPGSMDTVFI
jgi:hypothetical protein